MTQWICAWCMKRNKESDQTCVWCGRDIKVYRKGER